MFCKASTVAAAQGIASIALCGAANRQVEFVGGGIHRSRCDADRPGRKPAVDVQHRDGFDLRIVHRAGLDHRQRTARPFFGRLEEQHDAPVQRVARPLQLARSSEQHRRMRVVSAGVHLSRDLRAAVLARILADRQGVHVGAQAAHMSGQCAADDADHTRCRNATVFDAQRRQFALDDRLGIVLFEAELGMTVNFAPYLDRPRGRIIGNRGAHAGVLARPHARPWSEPP